MRAHSLRYPRPSLDDRKPLWVRSLRPHRNGEYFLTLDNDGELELTRKYKSNLDRLMN